MTPVGGVVVTVSLFAVAMAAVFGADDVGLLERRAGGAAGRKRGGRRGRIQKEEDTEESKNQESTPRLIQSRPSEGPNWMLHVACNEIQH